MYKRGRKVLMIMTMIAVLLCFGMTGTTSYAQDETDMEDMDGMIERQAGSKELRTIGEQLRKHSGEDFCEIVEGYDPDRLIQDAARGAFKPGIPGILNKVSQYMLKEIYTNIDILIKLIVLVVICAILRNLQASFAGSSVAEVAFYACYIAVISIATLSFGMAMKMGIDIIDRMVGFMYATVPVLITLLVSGGNITSGGIFQPVMIMIVQVSAVIIKNIFIPLVFLSTVLSIINHISDKVQISKAAGFMKQITGWGLGALLTIFVAVVSVQGAMGAVVDGITSKTAKFAIGTFIPVAGKYLADAADTVLGCTLLIKNAAGIAVMIGVVAICLLPLAKMIALIAIYRIAGVLIEPVAEKRITDCLNDIAGSITYIFGITAAVAFMFLISVTAIISASNLSAMIR